MDSLLSKKASINPVAEASSDGPAPPPSTSRAAQESLAARAKNGKRKKNVESVLESLIVNIREEREEVKKQRFERQEEKEVRRAEKLRMYAEKLAVQNSLLDILKTLANK